MSAVDSRSDSLSSASEADLARTDRSPLADFLESAWPGLWELRKRLRLTWWHAVAELLATALVTLVIADSSLSIALSSNFIASAAGIGIVCGCIVCCLVPPALIAYYVAIVTIRGSLPEDELVGRRAAASFGYFLSARPALSYLLLCLANATSAMDENLGICAALLAVYGFFFFLSAFVVAVPLRLLLRSHSVVASTDAFSSSCSKTIGFSELVQLLVWILSIVSNFAPQVWTAAAVSSVVCVGATWLAMLRNSPFRDSRMSAMQAILLGMWLFAPVLRAAAVPMAWFAVAAAVDVAVSAGVWAVSPFRKELEPRLPSKVYEPLLSFGRAPDAAASTVAATTIAAPTATPDAAAAAASLSSSAASATMITRQASPSSTTKIWPLAAADSEDPFECHSGSGNDVESSSSSDQLVSVERCFASYAFLLEECIDPGSAEALIVRIFRDAHGVMQGGPAHFYDIGMKINGLCAQACSKFSRSSELQLLWAYVLLDLYSMATAGNDVWRVRLNKVVHLIKATGPVFSFETFCLSGVVHARGRSSTGPDKRTMRKGIRKLEHFRRQGLQVIYKFWRSVLVDDKNSMVQFSMVSDLAMVVSLADAEMRRLDRQFEDDPHYLRAKARFMVDVEGNVALGREMLIRADYLEEKESKVTGSRSQTAAVAGSGLVPAAAAYRIAVFPDASGRTSTSSGRQQHVRPLRDSKLRFREAAPLALQDAKDAMPMTPQRGPVSAGDPVFEPLPASEFYDSSDQTEGRISKDCDPLAVRRPADSVPENGCKQMHRGDAGADDEDQQSADDVPETDAYDDGAADDGHLSADMGRHSHSSSSAGSRGSTGLSRMRQLRDSVLSRASPALRQMKWVLWISVIINVAVLFAFYGLSAGLIKQPMNQVAVNPGDSVTVDSTALTYAIEAANRLASPLAWTSVLGRYLIAGFDFDQNDIVSLNFMVDEYDTYEGRLVSRSLGSLADNFLDGYSIYDVFSSIANITAESPYFMPGAQVSPEGYLMTPWSTQRNTIIPLLQRDMHQMQTCSQEGLNGTNFVCGSAFLQLLYNGDGVGWTTWVGNVLPDMESDLIAQVQGIQATIIGVSVALAAVVALLVVLVLFPAISTVERERLQLLLLMRTLEKSSVRKLQDSTKAKLDSDSLLTSGLRGSSGGGVADAAADGLGTSSGLQRRRMYVLFAATICVMLICSESFSIILGVYTSEVLQAVEQVTYFPQVHASAVRCLQNTVEMFVNTLSPYGNWEALNYQALYRVDLMMRAWRKIMTTGGTYSPPISSLSSDLNNLLTARPCTDNTTSCASLDSIITDIADNVAYFGAATNPAEMSPSNPLYQRILVPVRDILPSRLNQAYNELVLYHVANITVMQNVAVAMLVVSFFVFPVVIFFGMLRQIHLLDKNLLQLRRIFLLLPLDIIERHPTVMEFMQGGNVFGQSSSSSTSSSSCVSMAGAGSGGAFGRYGAGRNLFGFSSNISSSEAKMAVATAGRLHQILMNAIDGFLELSGDSSIVQVNASCCNMFRRKAEDMIGLPLGNFLSSDGALKLQSLLDARQVGQFDFDCLGLVPTSGGDAGCGGFPIRVALSVARKDGAGAGGASSDWSPFRGHGDAGKSAEPINGAAAAIASSRGGGGGAKSRPSDLICGVFIRDRTFEVKQAALIEDEKRKGQDLLANIIPLQVSGRLMRNERPIVFSHEKVAVMFADIVSFTPLSKSLGAVGTVEMLDKLIGRWDDIIYAHRCTKIKTIGDCIFACSGFVVDGQPIDPNVRPEEIARRNFTADLVLAGLELVQAAAEMNIRIRVGINVGPCISGVVGRRKLMYDSLGPAINEASRYESSARPGTMLLSRTAYEMVFDIVECQERVVALKGLGDAKAYEVLSLKNPLLQPTS